MSLRLLSSKTTCFLTVSPQPALICDQHNKKISKRFDFPWDSRLTLWWSSADLDNLIRFQSNTSHASFPLRNKQPFFQNDKETISHSSVTFCFHIGTSIPVEGTLGKSHIHDGGLSSYGRWLWYGVLWAPRRYFPWRHLQRRHHGMDYFVPAYYA